MANIKVEEIKRYTKAIKASKQRHLTCEDLAKEIGLYPDVIARTLSFFDPVVNIDMDYEVRDLLPELENFIREKEKTKKAPKKNISNIRSIKSVNEFIFAKYVIGGGLIDRNRKLTLLELNELKRIINNEIKLNKPKKRR